VKSAFKLTSLAKRLKTAVESGDDLTDELLEFQESFSSSDGFWYHITLGYGDGFLDDILASEKQRAEVRDAIEKVREFEKLYRKLAAEM
jgi:hypothetical protein